MSQFGSGWAWLVHDGYRVLIVTTTNQDSPISDGLDAAARHRRLGARVLPRLREPPRGLRRRVAERRRLGGRRASASPPRRCPTSRTSSRGSVSVCGDEHEFGEVTLDEARAQSAELRALAGWGPMAKVGAIAPRLGRPRAADAEGARSTTVAELEPGAIEKAAIDAVGHPARPLDGRAAGLRRRHPGAAAPHPSDGLRALPAAELARAAGRRRAARGRRSPAG